MPDSSPLYCGRCLVAVTLMIDASWVSTVRCPSCAETDSLENAFRESDAYLCAYISGDLTRETDPPRRYRFIPVCLTPENRTAGPRGDPS